MDWLGFDSTTFFLDKPAVAFRRSTRTDVSDSINSTGFINSIGSLRSFDSFGSIKSGKPMIFGAASSEYAYAWYLDNHEADFGSWSDFTTLEKSVEYPSLIPGNYTFHVKAKTRANEVSLEAVRSFSVVSGTDPDIPTNIGMINISPSTMTLASKGETQKLTATAIFNDGIQQILRNDVQGMLWESSNPAVAGVDSTGNVTAIENGVSEISCTYSYIIGRVSINVLYPHPAIAVSTTEINLTAIEGSDGSSQSFDISNTGIGEMAYQVIKEDAWFSLSPESGTLGQGQQITVTITPAASSMGAGNDSGIITITAAGAVGAPVYITVNLDVQENTAPGPGGNFTNSLGMNFKEILPGTFMMGSPTDESARDSNEIQHQVTLTQAYYMQTTEVTQGQWEAVLGSNPSYFDNCGSDCPVKNVSWNDAQEVSCLNFLVDFYDINKYFLTHYFY